MSENGTPSPLTESPDDEVVGATDEEWLEVLLEEPLLESLGIIDWGLLRKKCGPWIVSRDY